jgi:hypothetical protein
MTPLETYLHELRETRQTGQAQAETSYYSQLENLLNAVGRTLKPRVRCVMHPKNRGAGFPDGGLFSADQRVRGEQDLASVGQAPSRGVSLHPEVRSVPRVSRYIDQTPVDPTPHPSRQSGVG